jgi:hypothetical protein
MFEQCTTQKQFQPQVDFGEQFLATLVLGLEAASEKIRSLTCTSHRTSCSYVIVGMRLKRCQDWTVNLDSRFLGEGTLCINHQIRTLMV